jgi:hypothetical protein
MRMEQIGQSSGDAKGTGGPNRTFAESKLPTLVSQQPLAEDIPTTEEQAQSQIVANLWWLSTQRLGACLNNHIFRKLGE